jgi:hypothetical protein
VRHSFRVWSVIVATSVGVGLGFVGSFVGSFVGGSVGGSVGSFAQAKSKGAPAAAAAGPKKDVNACGCYKDGAGACFCGKKGKCACPGDCEPKGCEEKRNKEIEKEVAAETKKAHEADKKQRQASRNSDAKAPKPKPKPKPDGVGQ